MGATQGTSSRPRVVGPDAGVRLSAGPVAVTLKVTSDDSDRFTLVDYRVPPGFVAPPTLHHHTREDWAMYVTEGEVTFRFADGAVPAVAGTTVFVPVGADFAWSNARDEPARFLAIHAPAGFDRFFVDVARGIDEHGATVSPEVMQTVIPPLWERYGVQPENAEPPV